MYVYIGHVYVYIGHVYVCIGHNHGVTTVENAYNGVDSLFILRYNRKVYGYYNKLARRTGDKEIS